MATQESRELKSVGYELFILLLSILSVFNMVFIVGAELITGGGGPAVQVVLAVETVMTPIFVFDFLYSHAVAVRVDCTPLVVVSVLERRPLRDVDVSLAVSSRV